jgi:hypothetical protein
VKEFYNENYEEICENLFPKDLLELPDKITGFYLQSGLNKISKVGEASHDNRFGVSYSEEQAKGMVAFCELSQIRIHFIHHFLLQIIFALDKSVIK